MTQAQFESELRRLARRIQLLQEASSGKTKLRRVHVDACKVRSHHRGAHTRLVAPSGWKPRKS